MSLESDICLLTRSNTVNESLFKMGLLSTPDETFSIVTISDWRRSGAETFSYAFDVIGVSVRHLILKACVTLSFHRSLDAVVEEWQKRRMLLQAHNVSTPILYGYGNGTILEEFIPSELEQIFRKTSKPECIAADLGRIAAVLVSLGFCPNQVFHDFRSRGSDVVMIDFGEDLGPPGNLLNQQDLDCILRSLTVSLEKWRVPNRRELQQVASQKFWEVINSEAQRLLKKGNT